MTAVILDSRKMPKGIVLENNKNIDMKEETPTATGTTKKGSAIELVSRLFRLDSLSGKKSLSLESPTSTEPPAIFYGVYIPCEIKKGPDEEALHVYSNKSEALELLKKYRLARFKAFNNRQDAVSFALRGAEPADVEGGDNSLMGEKPYPFKAPSPQEMVSLRKTIEAGLVSTVRDRVWDNPRYLVSSGSTPAILQEGSRYNALHVAAKAMNAELCNLILTTVGNPLFVQTLYGMDADEECCKEFAGILVDRYLNTPDKAMNETPLHFAAKFGAEDAVDVLTSFPQCNKDAVNKFGEKPKDIIGKRSADSTPESIRRIARILNERYYVPVLHSEDDSLVPTIGNPFTPAKPPALNQDPLSPRYEIRAFAGPMQSSDAECFRRKWKTPPRNIAAPTFRLRELSKGLESVGRNLAEEMRVGWKEYWPFLDTFTDLKSPEGLSLLEIYLKNKYETACISNYMDSCLEVINDDLSLSKISLGNISTHSPFKDSSMSPMSELCHHLKACTITSDYRPPHWRKTDPVRQRLCRQPTAKTAQRLISNGETQSPVNHTVSQLLCIERTCQVFAKRIADGLVFSLASEPEFAGAPLKSESKHLQHTMYTYMYDDRFKNIDFALVHSRLAQLIVFKLREQNIVLDDVNLLIEFLVKLRCPNDDIFSSDDESRPTFRGPNRVTLKQLIYSHVRCLAGFISEELGDVHEAKGPAVSEIECTSIWGKVSKCHCEWNVDFSERNSKKNASFRKNRSLLSTSPKTESFIKRLTFDLDIGDSRAQNDVNVIIEKVGSANTPGGDSSPSLYTVKMDKCQVVDTELISDDESGKSSDEDEYATASEHSADEEMFEATDKVATDIFIYGDEPTKMDRLVFDALSGCQLSREQFPNISRWQHNINLYSSSEREKWRVASLNDDSIGSPMTCSFSLGAPNTSRQAVQRRSLKDVQSPSLNRCSTPKKGDGSLNDSTGRAVSLQVSNWMRVTGPNSPRSALATKNVGHNISLGF